MVERGEADAILCWAVNRLTRNPIDAGRLSWLLQNSVLKAIQTAEKQFLPSDNVLLLAIETSVANQDIITMRKNVARGTQTKLMLGWSPHRAPEGYLNEAYTHTIVPDRGQADGGPDRFALMQRAWRLVAAGTHTPASAIRVLNEEWGYRTRRTPSGGGGVPLSRSAGFRIFRNPFYTGHFRHGPDTYKGSHEPMVTPEEFDAAQRRIDGQVGRAHRRRHEFAYAGLIRCGRCGRAVTPERQPGRHGRGDWVYYHCGNGDGSCDKRSVREDALERQIAGWLAGITIDAEFRAVVLAALEEWLRTEAEGGLGGSYDALSAALADAERQSGELLDLRLRGVIDDATFAAKQRDLRDTAARTRQSLERVQRRLDRARAAVTGALEFRMGARDRFLTGDAARRREVARSLALGYRLVDGKVVADIHPLLSFVLEKNPDAGRSRGRSRAVSAARRREFEPRRVRSGSTKETSPCGKVSVGWTPGTEIEPLREIFEMAADDTSGFQLG
jgi:hypothetical protein